MKKIINIAFILLLSISVKAQDTRILDVSMIYQEQTYWCWAACTQMIFDYYGISLEQCEIAEIARILDYTYNPYPRFGGSNCCNPNNGCNRKNSFTNYVFSYGSIQAILDSLSISSSKIGSNLQLSEIKSEIDAWEPFIIYWKWVNESDGHFVICRGYDTASEKIYINDPLQSSSYTGGATIECYDWVISGTGNNNLHQWTSTLVLDTQPSCGNSESYFTGPVTSDVNCSETDYVEMNSSISNSSAVSITFGSECVLSGGFEIATGSSLMITPSSSLNCN